MKQADSFKAFIISLRQLHIPPIFQSSLTALYKIGAFGAFSAVFVYIFQYGDKATERQERLWTALREATAWREIHPNAGGNIGQNHILEALTSDCSKFYKDFFFGYFFRDCVDLSSITLLGMDLRGLKIPGSVVKDSDFSCSNLGKANLRGSDLSSVIFKATDLTDADFSGATLSDACFYNANVQGAKFYDFKEKDVNLVLDRLKNSCISYEAVGQKKTILSDRKEIRDFAEKLNWCSGWIRCDKNPPGCPDSIIE